MSKLITDALVAARMEARGYKEDVREEVAYELVMSFYDSQVISDWSSAMDFYIYQESTADGYEVTIATSDYNNLDISSDVHYYTPDLADILIEQIKMGSTIYCDDPEIVDQSIEIMYPDLLEIIEEEVRDELLDEGYEELITIPKNVIQYIQMLSQDPQFNKESMRYSGALNVDTAGVGFDIKYGPSIVEDSERFEFVFNHFGLTIKRAVKGELILEAWKD